MKRGLIVVAEGMSDDALARLAAGGDVRVLDACDDQTLAEALADCEALVVRTYTQVTAALLAKASRLRVIGRAGVGLDNIDLDAARARNIRVVYTPDALTNAVAEHTVGLMLALERHLIAGHRMMHERQFAEARRTFISRELRGLTLGVVGMGRIGRAVAAVCSCGLGMRIVYNDVVDVADLPFEASPLTKEELFATSDVVTLHVPLTDLTRRMIDGDALRRFKSSATLINTSRGAVVNAEALATGLREGRLAGAAIDVHDPEPPGEDYPLLGVTNCLLSPHVASRTEGGQSRTNDVVDDVLAVLRGQEPAFPAF